jgi:hypothetical protein
LLGRDGSDQQISIPPGAQERFRVMTVGQGRTLDPQGLYPPGRQRLQHRGDRVPTQSFPGGCPPRLALQSAADFRWPVVQDRGRGKQIIHQRLDTMLSADLQKSFRRTAPSRRIAAQDGAEQGVFR